MNEQQLTLTRLLGKKKITFGCIILVDNGKGKELPEIVVERRMRTNNPGHHFNFSEIEILFTDRGNEIIIDFIHEDQIIGHPATLSDLHRWINEKTIQWQQDRNTLIVNGDFDYPHTPIDYDSSKDLLDQSTEILDKIIELIKSNS